MRMLWRSDLDIFTQIFVQSVSRCKHLSADVKNANLRDPKIQSKS